MVFLLNMKAEKSQIPGTESQTVSQTNVGKQPTDAIWSHLRRIEDRVKSIELALSTARRDINRIDKSIYREKDKSPPSEIKGNGEQDYHPALFGV